jgi:hypothetical protein
VRSSVRSTFSPISLIDRQLRVCDDIQEEPFGDNLVRLPASPGQPYLGACHHEGLAYVCWLADPLSLPQVRYPLRTRTLALA